MERCPNCKNNIEKDWIICPYCSFNLKEYNSQKENNADEMILQNYFFQTELKNDSFNLLETIEFEKGQKIENWEFIKKIGVGDNSLVWLVEDTLLNEKRALKIIPDFNDNFTVLDDYKLRMRIDSKNIIKAEKPNKINYLEQYFYFYPLEYVESGNLNSVINELSKINNLRELEDNIIKIYLKICEVVNSFHKIGIINLNLKHENIFYISGIMKISDIAWDENRKKNSSNDKFADIYSLGIILYKILSESKILSIDLAKIKISEQNDQNSSDLFVNIIKKCLLKDEKKGFDDIEDLISSIKQLWLTIKENREKVDKLKENAVFCASKNDYSQAIENLNTACSIEPQNDELKNLLKKFKKQKLDYLYHQEDKKIFMKKHNFIFVKGGAAKIGNIKGQDCEMHVHTVALNSFYISKYPVTLKEWKEFVKQTGYQFDWQNNSWGRMPVNKYCLTDNHPIINVNWFEAVEYCNWKSKVENLIPCYTVSFGKYSLDILKNGYRLPTEAEWEYAAKGGLKSNNTKYSGSNKYKEVAWTKENTTFLNKVGLLKPNELGIYDMSGNIFEWCNDWFFEDYYKESEYENPLGPKTGSKKVLRGGAWLFRADISSVYARYKEFPDTRREFIGFRICRTDI